MGVPMDTYDPCVDLSSAMAIRKRELKAASNRFTAPPVPELPELYRGCSPPLNKDVFTLLLDTAGFDSPAASAMARLYAPLVSPEEGKRAEAFFAGATAGMNGGDDVMDLIDGDGGMMMVDFDGWSSLM